MTLLPVTSTPDPRYAEERGIALRAKATQEAAAAATAVEPAEQDSSSRGGTPDSFTVNIEHDSSATTATVAAAVPKTGATHAAGLHSGDHGAGGGVGGGDRSDGSGGGGEAATAAGGPGDSEPTMEFVGCDGKVHTVALLREVIYLTDMDATR